MLSANTVAAEPRLLHTEDCKINGISFQVSVCQSPDAQIPLKQKMKSIVLQRAENERKKLSET